MKKERNRRRKGTSVAILQDRFCNRHSWLLRKIDSREDYIIQGLSVKDALRLFKETNDEKYVAHVFFDNLGYFLNTIVACMSLFGEDFRYTEVNDYLSYAYIAVREGMERFDIEKSDKVMSYLAGAVFLKMRIVIRQEETRWWKEYYFSAKDEYEEADYSAGVEHYMKAGEQSYEAIQNMFDVNEILRELFERFKEPLAKLGIYSVDEMYKLYGEWSCYSNYEKNLIARLRKEMRALVNEKYRDFLQ